MVDKDESPLRGCLPVTLICGGGILAALWMMGGQLVVTFILACVIVYAGIASGLFLGVRRLWRAVSVVELPPGPSQPMAPVVARRSSDAPPAPRPSGESKAAWTTADASALPPDPWETYLNMLAARRRQAADAISSNEVELLRDRSEHQRRLRKLQVEGGPSAWDEPGTWPMPSEWDIELRVLSYRRMGLDETARLFIDPGHHRRSRITKFRGRVAPHG